MRKNERLKVDLKLDLDGDNIDDKHDNLNERAC